MSKIHFLKNTEIDRKKWAETLSRCPNRQIFAEDWFLDIVSPGWGALIRGDYEEIFPLPIKKFLGVSYLVQPKFSPQLGLFSPQSAILLCDDFIAEMQKRFRRYQLSLNTKSKLSKYQGIKTINCELELNKPYEALYSGFSKNAKRNIRKFRKSDNISFGMINFDRFFDFKLKSLKNLKPDFYSDFRSLNEAFTKEKIPVKCLSVIQNENLLASAMLVKYYDRIYYFNGASSPEGKQYFAMFGLFDYFIKTESETDKILDFKGGQMPGTLRFFKSFGAKEIPFLRVVRKF